MVGRPNSRAALAFSFVVTFFLSGALAHAREAPPNLQLARGLGWISYGPEYIHPPSGPKPVASDPAHPFIANAGEYFGRRRPGAIVEEQPTFPVADLSNPILQPWAREELRKRNDHVLSGKPLFEPRTSCWPSGVPAFNLDVVMPTYFIQTADKVWIITTWDNQVRRIHLNVPHAANAIPSWYGDSVGHYEGDTLVVDTIGMNNRTFVDNFRTPHSTQLHVVERFKMVGGGDTLEVNITVEDPGAFTTPWSATQRFRRSDSPDPARRLPLIEDLPLVEDRCAENNVTHFDFGIEPIPTADTPDF